MEQWREERKEVVREGEREEEREEEVKQRAVGSLEEAEALESAWAFEASVSVVVIVAEEEEEEEGRWVLRDRTGEWVQVLAVP